MCSIVKVVLICVSWTLIVGQDINEMKNMPKYDARYDYLDVDGILENKRLVRNYVDCLINAKPCTPEGKALKRVLPEALRTKCVRCTEKQKRTAVNVIRRLKYGYPDEWAKLSSRWDPTGDFTRFFEEYLAKETFNTISGTSSEVPLPAPLPAVPPRLPFVPPPPPPTSTQPPTPTPVGTTTAAPPILLNRFGDEGELMMGSHSSAGSMGTGSKGRPYLPPAMPTQVPTTRPPTTTTTRPPTPSTRPTMPAVNPGMPSFRPAITNRPPTTIMTWVAGSSDSSGTRFPLRPESSPQTTMITIIDQIGYKIIRTTELFTDILKNTVKAVIG